MENGSLFPWLANGNGQLLFPQTFQSMLKSTLSANVIWGENAQRAIRKRGKCEKNRRCLKNSVEKVKRLK
jgi:hypothetical protein